MGIFEYKSDFFCVVVMFGVIEVIMYVVGVIVD